MEEWNGEGAGGVDWSAKVYGCAALEGVFFVSLISTKSSARGPRQGRNMRVGGTAGGRWAGVRLVELGTRKRFRSGEARGKRTTDACSRPDARAMTGMVCCLDYRSLPEP